MILSIPWYVWISIALATLAWFGISAICLIAIIGDFGEWSDNRRKGQRSRRAQRPPSKPVNPRFEMSGVWGKDEHGNMVDLRIADPRRAYERLTGKSAKDYVPRFIHPDQRLPGPQLDGIVVYRIIVSASK